jgi:DNA-binding transcriptional regulator/RsmH inhibitor MraZ
MHLQLDLQEVIDAGLKSLFPNQHHRLNISYFARTRVELDKDGHIIPVNEKLEVFDPNKYYKTTINLWAPDK